MSGATGVLPARKKVLGLDVAEVIALIAFAAASFALALRHEPWADEAQAWLVARDNGWLSLLFAAVRYEGTPALWHVLLKLLMTVGLPYEGLGIVSCLLSTASAYVLLRFAPFPRALKCVLPFTYFLFYQYGVVARSYSLTVLLLFLLAALYGRRLEKPLLFAALCGLLANANLHGAILSGFLVLFAAAGMIPQYRALEKRQKAKLLGAFSLYAALALLALAQAWSPVDASFAADTRLNAQRLTVTLLNAVLESGAGSFRISFSFPLLLIAMISTVAFDLFTLLFLRKKRMLAQFLLPSAALIALYAAKHYSKWHLGLFFVYAIFTLWIAWDAPEAVRSRPRATRQNENKRANPKVLRTLVTISLCVVAAVQIAWSGFSFAYDWRQSYSGGKEAADVLKSVAKPRSTIAGLGINCTSLSPYFQTNPYENINPNTGKAYWFWSKNSKTDVGYQNIVSQQPDFIVVDMLHNADDAAKLNDNVDYEPVRYVKGAIFWKDSVLAQEDFTIYRRVREKQSGGAG